MIRLFPQALRRFACAALGVGVAALAAAMSPALAQTSAADPPDRVARLSEVSGQAWVYDPDRGEWIEALRNRPLTTGNRLATDADAHAEVQLGATTLRLDEDTELEVLQLDDDHFSLQLHGGSVEAQVRDPSDAASFELTTESGRFVVQTAGRYRFDQEGAQSTVTVLDGQALYQGIGTALPVEAGQRGTFWIDAAGIAQYTLGAPVDDAFARWSSERDRQYAQLPAPQYVSPEMTGAQDLERYGNWEQTTEYGAVWTPYVVPSGWAPYSAGHWTWVSPWGWTWVDDAPWGYAPFHYGRWVHLRNRWCWTPGVRVARPVYAPALVAWVGGPQANVSISVSGGRSPAVGWFPLAPHEVYVPSYRVSPRYVRSINITHVTNVANITRVVNRPHAPRHFANRGLPHAVTMVPESVMTGRRPVAPAAAQLRRTPGGHDLAGRPAHGVALLNPPVAAPERPSRPADPRAIRPPPGVPAAVGRSRAIAPGAPSLRPRAVAPNGAVNRPHVVESGDTQRPGHAGTTPRPGAGRVIRPPESTVGRPPAVQPAAPARMRRPTAPSREDRRIDPASVRQRPVETHRPQQPRVVTPMRSERERALPIAPEARRAQAPRPRAEPSPARRAEPPQRGSNRNN
jgi:hypothetical protein